MIPNTILYQQKRFRGKINVTKPRKPHYLRGVVNTFLTPFYRNENEGKSLEEMCTNVKAKLNKVNKEQYNPYQRIIAREVRNWYDESKMIAICHQNSMTMEERFELLDVPLRKANMYSKQYSYKIMKLALEDSPYATSLPLYKSRFILIFCPDINVAAFEKVIKKCPSVILLGGILEGHLLSKNNFLRYGKLDLTTSRMHLVQILQNAGGNKLNQQLTQHQSTLVARLQQISMNETTPDEDEKPVSV